MASTSVSEQTARVFSFWRLLTHTKTVEELITELLFTDDCALLGHMEEAVRHIANCFSDAAKNFGLTISLKKTDVVPTPSTRSVQSSSHQHRWHQPQSNGALYLPC